MPELVEITTTVETCDQANKIAKNLVQNRLAGCVQVEGPIRSVYVWQAELCESDEYRCLIKTLPKCLPRIEAFFQQHHPYDVPQFLVSNVTSSQAYAAWMAEQVE